MAKKALITGITGQDGSYLAEFLLKKGYTVHGIKRRSSSFNTERIDHIFQDQHEKNVKLHLHYGDMTDMARLSSLIYDIKPDEVYNLAAQSHVAVSFDMPNYTTEVNANGTLNLLEAIKSTNLIDTTKFYQASSSEIYGLVQETPQTEKTPFYPRSPYGVSKLFSYWITVNYRESYNLFASNGILFNHESPRRGETFVTRKITRGLAKIILSLEKCLYLGNLNALRDWGHARDYVRMQWMILQHHKPDDFVIATEKQISVREFLEIAAEELGIRLKFSGSEENEIGYVDYISEKIETELKLDDVIVKIDPKYFRPAEVDNLIGSPQKAIKDLGWKPEISLRDMIREMVNEDLKLAKNIKLLKEKNYK